jgi:hypothetical protein
MRNDMKKKNCFLLAAVVCGAIWYSFFSTAAETVPSYVEIPGKGEYTMGGESTAGDGDTKLGTKFYLRIENPIRLTETETSGETEEETQPGTEKETSGETEARTPEKPGTEKETSGETETELPGESESECSWETEAMTEVKTPKEDEASGETEAVTETDASPKKHRKADTPDETESEIESETESGKLPKTGDYGLDKKGFLWAALIFGAGYLICDSYEKKYAKKETDTKKS